jgi:hypothetical protein
MTAADAGEVPDGAAVFPEIPAELGVHPLLLAVIHATIFLAGSDDDLVNPAAADEAVERIGTYLRRLDGPQLAQVREDMACLIAHARQQQWPKGLVRALQSLLGDFGVGNESETQDG